jgi:hypothetical protein
VSERRLTWIYQVLCRCIEKVLLRIQSACMDKDLLLIFLALKGLSEVSY